MNDCSNADIRDRLPDLLHEQLDAMLRAEVLAHVDGCVDCRAELELLRRVQKTLIAQTRRVDVASIVRALPKPPARPADIQPLRRRWADWRIAAAITVLVAGAGSVAVLNRSPRSTAPIDTVAIVPPVVATPVPSAITPPVATSPRLVPKESASRAPETVIAANDDPDVSADAGPDGRFAGLSEDQLKTLLGEIDRLQAVPVTEPEPVTIRVDLKPNGLEGRR